MVGRRSPIVRWWRGMKRHSSLTEIRAEMQRRIDSSEWAAGHCSGCPAPAPYRIPNDGLANWTANIAATPTPGGESLILRVVAETRSEFDLPAESLKDAIGRRFFRQARTKD